MHGEPVDGQAVRVDLVEQGPHLGGAPVGGDPDGQAGRVAPGGPAVQAPGGLLEGGRVGQHQVEPLAGDLLLELGRGAVGDHPPAVQDGDPVGQAVRLLQVLGGQQHRHPLRGQLGHDLPHRLAAARVQAGGGLVQEDHRGPDDQAGGQVQAPAHAARPGLHRPAAGLGQVEALQQLGRPAAGRGAGQAGQAAHHAQVLLAGLEVVHGRELAGEADAAADLAAVGDDVEAGHPGPAGVGPGQGGQDAHGGGLAGPVGAEQGEHAALGHGQVDPGQDPQRAVGLLEAGRLDGQLVGHLPSFWVHHTVYVIHFTA